MQSQVHLSAEKTEQRMVDIAALKKNTNKNKQSMESGTAGCCGGGGVVSVLAEGCFPSVSLGTQVYQISQQALRAGQDVYLGA